MTAQIDTDYGAEHARLVAAKVDRVTSMDKFERDVQVGRRGGEETRREGEKRREEARRREREEERDVRGEGRSGRREAGDGEGSRPPGRVSRETIQIQSIMCAVCLYNCMCASGNVSVCVFTSSIT